MNAGFGTLAGHGATRKWITQRHHPGSVALVILAGPKGPDLMSIGRFDLSRRSVLAFAIGRDPAIEISALGVGLSVPEREVSALRPIGPACFKHDNFRTVLYTKAIPGSMGLIQGSNQGD